MGFGDEIMVTGQARVMQETDPRPVAVKARRGLARWHPLWEGNPRIATPAEVAGGLDVQWLKNNYPGRRPYADYTRTDDLRVVFNDWSCTAGDIYFSAAEIDWAERQGGGQFVVIGPNVKPKSGNPNKRWRGKNGQAHIDRMDGCGFIQFTANGGLLQGVRHVTAPSFRHACALLARARAYVGIEGGLHHAAAALGVPAGGSIFRPFPRMTMKFRCL